MWKEAIVAPFKGSTLKYAFAGGIEENHRETQSGYFGFEVVAAVRGSELQRRVLRRQPDVTEKQIT
jgi:hypothetical protein